jgi:hypothetical protein
MITPLTIINLHQGRIWRAPNEQPPAVQQAQRATREPAWRRWLVALARARPPARTGYFG